MFRHLKSVKKYEEEKAIRVLKKAGHTKNYSRLKNYLYEKSLISIRFTRQEQHPETRMTGFRAFFLTMKKSKYDRSEHDGAVATLLKSLKEMEANEGEMQNEMPVREYTILAEMLVS